MAGSESSVVRTILYLRPQTPETIDVLDIIENEPYRFEVAPPPEPIDIPLGKIPDLFLTTHLSPYGSTLPDHGRVTRESTPGPYSISPRVLRLGFDSIETPSAQGFELGYGPTSDIKVPYLSTDPSRNLRRAYLRIHYNFNSGALLITALDKIKVGSARLSPRQSVLLMAGTTIHCGGEYEFAVEYPDLSNCAEEHERNYQEYAAKLGVLGAQYMASSRAEDPPIGAEHRSKAILGRGAFGEVHLAWNTKTGAAFAIKKLIGKRVDAMKEVNIMSRLSHVCYFILALGCVLNI
jgi:hypothetical protein